MSDQEAHRDALDWNTKNPPFTKVQLYDDGFRQVYETIDEAEVQHGESVVRVQFIGGSVPHLLPTARLKAVEKKGVQ